MQKNECLQFRAGDNVNCLTIEVSVATGIIHVVGTGFWPPFLMNEHFAQLREAITPFRKMQRPVRMIVDLRHSQVQSAETVKLMQDSLKGVTELGDRIAMLVGSSLAKIQLRRTIGNAQHEFFLYPKAATKWVDSYAC